MDNENLEAVAERANILIAEDFADFGYNNPPTVSIGVARAVLRAQQYIEEESNFDDGLREFIMHTDIKR